MAVEEAEPIGKDKDHSAQKGCVNDPKAAYRRPPLGEGVPSLATSAPAGQEYTSRGVIIATRKWLLMPSPHCS